MTKKEEETTASESKATSSAANIRKVRGGRSSPRQQQQQHHQRERPPTPVSGTTAATAGGVEQSSSGLGGSIISSGRSSPHFVGSSSSAARSRSSGAAAAAAAAVGGVNTGSGGGSSSAPLLPPTPSTSSSSSSRGRGRGRGSERNDRDHRQQGRNNRKSSRRRGGAPPPPPAISSNSSISSGRRRRSDGGDSSIMSKIAHQDQQIIDTSDNINTGSGMSGKDELRQHKQSTEVADPIQVLNAKVEQMERQNKLLQEQLEQHFKATETEAERLRAELQSERNHCSRLNDELKSAKEETLAVTSSKSALSNRVLELERQLKSVTGGRDGSRSGSLSPRTNRVVDLERQLEEAVRTISNLRLQQSHQQSSPSTLSSSGNGGGDNGSKDGAGSKGSNNSNTQQSNLNASSDSSSTIGASERLDRAHQQIVILEAERKAEQERSRRLEQRLADLQSNFDRLSYDRQGRGAYGEGATPAGKGRDQYPSGGGNRSALKNQDSPPPITGEQLVELQAAFDRQAQLKPKTTTENPSHQGIERGPSTQVDNQVDPGKDRKVQGVKRENATDTQTLSKESAGAPPVEHGHAPNQGSRDESATKAGDDTPFCVLLKGIPPSTTPADVHKFLILHGVTDISYIKLAGSVDYAPETQGQGNVFITTDKGCMKAMSLTGQQIQEGYSLHVSPANIRTQSLFDGQAVPPTLPHPYMQPMVAQQTHDQQGEQSQYFPKDTEDTGHGGPLGTYCIYFRGAPYDKTPEEIYDFFVSHGVTTMQSFEVKQDDRTGRTSGDGYFYVKTKEGHEHVLSLHKKIFLGGRYIELFDGSNRLRSSSRPWLGRADDGGRGGRSGGSYANRRERYSSGNRRTYTSRSMQQRAGFYSPQNYSTDSQGLAPSHPQAHYEGNRYGNPQSQHEQQTYGQHGQEYHHHHQQHIHFQHHDGFQGMHQAAPMYGFVAPGYDIHGSNVYPSPQFNPETAGGGWYGGEMGGSIVGAPQEPALFPTIDLGMPASQYQQPQYPIQDNIGRPTFNQPPLPGTGINANPSAPGLLENDDGDDDDDDDDDPPDLVNEDSLPAFDQKDDMSYPNIGLRTTQIGSASTGGSTDSATEL